VSRDFLPQVFYFKQLLLAPVDKPSNDFDFFRIFAEIFDYYGASPVSTTPVMHALPVSLTPAKTCIAGVNDTGEVGDIYCPVSMTPLMHDVTGVNYTGNVMHHRCH
jgi:hypothetical protein